MICTNCKTGADQRARAEVHIARYNLPSTLPEVSAILDAAVEQNDTGNMGPVLTVALALRSVDESHADCLGGEQGCGCQHRGTTAERRPATTP